MLLQVSVPVPVVASFIGAVIAVFLRSVLNLFYRFWKLHEDPLDKSIDWLNELRSISERIEHFAVFSYSEDSGISQYNEEISSTLRGVDDIFEREISTVKEYNDAFSDQYGIRPLDNDPSMTVPDNSVDDIKNAMSEELRELPDRKKESLQERTHLEMYEFAKELSSHFAQRNLRLNESTIEQFVDLQSHVYSLSVAETVTEEDLEDTRNLVDNLKEEIKREKRNRLKSNITFRIRSKVPIIPNRHLPDLSEGD